MKNDSELQHDVIEELEWDPRVEHERIGVTAKDGVITLSGFVPNYAQKVAAEQAARRVNGVRAIAEEIEVRFANDPKTSDAAIAKRILDILAWDVTVPETLLKVKVEHGMVTLTGEVEWQYQNEAAQKLAGRIAGVKGVINRIEVRARASVRDIRERIIAAFDRSSEIDASAIKIDVTDGTVRLTGRVHGWNERKTAEKAAWSAPGVTRVEDQIVLA